MADNKTPIKENTPDVVASDNTSIKEASKDESVKKEVKDVADKVNEKVADPNEPEQPESKTEEDEKQVAKDSEEDGDELENKQFSRRMTKAELINELNDMKEDMEVISTKLGEKDQAVTKLQAEVETYKEQIKQMEQASEKYKALLSEIVEAKKNSIPKEVQDLLPEGTLEQQLAWLNKAEQSGLGTVKADKPVVEIGKPMNIGVPQADTSKMTPQQKLSSYFAQVFTK